MSVHTFAAATARVVDGSCDIASDHVHTHAGEVVRGVAGARLDMCVTVGAVLWVTPSG